MTTPTATPADGPETLLPMAPPATQGAAFTFGDPVPVLDGRDILDYLECWTNGRWYEPPVDPSGLAKTFRASTHHASALYFKRNLLASRFVPHRWLNRETFSAWALDYLVFGNAYLERPRNMLGGAMQLRHALAKYVRRGGDALERYWFVQSTQEHEFTPGSLHHLREHDINQEVYGLPEYLAALQSAWLNESATLFRRRYYNNGSHAGFILYVSDPQQNQQDVDNIREALKNSKGPGNFRNLFLYSPGGKKDGVQVIPVSEVAARDEFTHIKNVSRDDVLAAHRIPPQLLGIVPQNSGGFGSITEAAKIFHASEIEPLQQRLAMINDWLGEEVVTFLPYVTEAPAGGA